MIDWRKYPNLAEALLRYEPVGERLADDNLTQLLTDVRRAERTRCAEACKRKASVVISNHDTAIRNRAYNDCAAAIEALGDED